jgi:hypothetical protein
MRQESRGSALRRYAVDPNGTSIAMKKMTASSLPYLASVANALLNCR